MDPTFKMQLEHNSFIKILSDNHLIELVADSKLSGERAVIESYQLVWQWKYLIYPVIAKSKGLQTFEGGVMNLYLCFGGIFTIKFWNEWEKLRFSKRIVSMMKWFFSAIESFTYLCGLEEDHNVERNSSQSLRKLPISSYWIYPSIDVSCLFRYPKPVLLYLC